jgi:hypothetical protein
MTICNNSPQGLCTQPSPCLSAPEKLEGSITLPIQPKRTTPIRKGSLNRLPWVEATGSSALLSDKATFYVMKVFDYP